MIQSIYKDFLILLLNEYFTTNRYFKKNKENTQKC